MKKLFTLLIAIASVQVAFASDTADIKIKISGATSDNRYFLCLPNVGCLSLLGAQKGKVFPMYRSVDTSSMFVADANNNFHLSPQAIPSSCNGTVDTNHTVTISGNIAAGNNGSVRVNHLRCTIS